MQLTDEDVEKISEALAAKIRTEDTPTPDETEDTLTPDEVKSVKDLLTTKNGVVRITMYVFLALAAYAMKDVYYGLVKLVHYLTGAAPG